MVLYHTILPSATSIVGIGNPARLYWTRLFSKSVLHSCAATWERSLRRPYHSTQNATTTRTSGAISHWGEISATGTTMAMTATSNSNSTAAASRPSLCFMVQSPHSRRTGRFQTSSRIGKIIGLRLVRR